jgi:hypothetical protein
LATPIGASVIRTSSFASPATSSVGDVDMDYATAPALSCSACDSNDTDSSPLDIWQSSSQVVKFPPLPSAPGRNPDSTHSHLLSPSTAGRISLDAPVFCSRDAKCAAHLLAHLAPPRLF